MSFQHFALNFICFTQLQNSIYDCLQIFDYNLKKVHPVKKTLNLKEN